MNDLTADRAGGLKLFWSDDAAEVSHTSFTWPRINMAFWGRKRALWGVQSVAGLRFVAYSFRKKDLRPH